MSDKTNRGAWIKDHEARIAGLELALEGVVNVLRDRIAALEALEARHINGGSGGNDRGPLYGLPAAATTKETCPLCGKFLERGHECGYIPAATCGKRVTGEYWCRLPRGHDGPCLDPVRDARRRERRAVLAVVREKVLILKGKDGAGWLLVRGDVLAILDEMEARK